MSTPASERFQAIDIVRLYAMLAMLFSHAAASLGQSLRLTTGWDTTALPRHEGLGVALGLILHLATPLFALLTGFSVAFYIVSRQRRAAPERTIDAFLLRRGLFLLALGLFVDSFEMDPPRWTFDPGILGMFGLGLWLLIPLRRLSPAGLFASAGLVVAAVQVYLALRGKPMGPGWVEALFLTSGAERGMIFPVLPWLPVILLGFAAGRLVAEKRVGLDRLGFVLGLGLLGLWAGLWLVGHPPLFRKHPPSLDFQLPYLGVGFLLLALHARYRQPEAWWFYRTFVVLGRCALFFYLIHAQVVLNGLAVLVAPLRLPLPWSAALLGLLALLVLVPLCRAVLKYGPALTAFWSGSRKDERPQPVGALASVPSSPG